MILKCSYCGGKMRVDEQTLPYGKTVRVRCPHCKGVGLTAHPHPQRTAIVPGLDVETGPQPSAPTPTPAQSAAPAAESSDVPHADPEPMLPEDAFSDFRFPSEGDPRKTVSPARPRSSKTRVAVWLGASVGIILFFAMLVNLILPGPPR